MRSRRGVRMFGLPNDPRSPYPRSSARMMMMFGGVAGCAVSDTVAIAPASRSDLASRTARYVNIAHLRNGEPRHGPIQSRSTPATGGSLVRRRPVRVHGQLD